VTITIEERIEQIQAKAQERGFDLKKTRPAAARIPRPAEDRSNGRTAEPKRHVPSVLTKPLPCSWMKRRNKELLPHEQRRAADMRKLIEKRLAAGLVCKALGTGWHRKIEERGHWREVSLCHVSGLRLSFDTEHNRDGRYTIGLADCFRSNEYPESITVSASRSPAAIAVDIQRRLIDAGAMRAHEETIRGRARSREERVDARLKMLRVARAGGHHQLSKTNRQNSELCPETNTMRFHGVSVRAARGYLGRIEITVEAISTETAEEIVRMIGTHCGPVCSACSGSGLVDSERCDCLQD
jgi:hypothetical protein